MEYASFVGDSDSSEYAALLRALIYIEHDVFITKIECKNNQLQNLMNHLRNTLKSGRMRDTAFLKTELKRNDALRNDAFYDYH